MKSVEMAGSLKERRNVERSREQGMGSQQRDLYLRLKQQEAIAEWGVSGVEMQAERGIDFKEWTWEAEPSKRATGYRHGHSELCWLWMHTDSEKGGGGRRENEDKLRTSSKRAVSEGEKILLWSL